MRMLMKVSMPHQEFNEMVREGNVEQTLTRIIDETKPEAVYFTEMEGYRTLLMIIDVADSSQVPTYAEPWFLLLGADVQFHILMTLEDIGRAGLSELGKKWA